MKRWTDRRTDGKIERPIDRQADRMTLDERMNGRTDRNSERICDGLSGLMHGQKNIENGQAHGGTDGMKRVISIFEL